MHVVNRKRNYELVSRNITSHGFPIHVHLYASLAFPVSQIEIQLNIKIQIVIPEIICQQSHSEWTLSAYLCT